MLCELAQGRLNLSREVEALVGGDDVVVAQLEVAVEPTPQLKQNRLELSEQPAFRTCESRWSSTVSRLQSREVSYAAHSTAYSTGSRVRTMERIRS
jgi:hypothetical protein